MHHSLLQYDLFLLHNCCINLLNKIKSLKRHIPVILTTAHGNIDQYLDESNLEGMMLLSKPIKYDELKRIIETIEAQSEEAETVKNNPENAGKPGS